VIRFKADSSEFTSHYKTLEAEQQRLATYLQETCEQFDKLITLTQINQTADRKEIDAILSELLPLPVCLVNEQLKGLNQIGRLCNELVSRTEIFISARLRQNAKSN
jgi:hypothetical protein